MTGRFRTRRRVAAVLAAGALLVGATSAHAMTVSELSAGVRSARETSSKLARSKWNNGAETKLVERLDRLADGFHDLAADGASMPKTAAGLVELLESVRKRYVDVLEKLQADVIRIDGDLEAVQDSPAWRQREVLAMRVLYRLNWVRYERAMRYETSTTVRKRLLVKARAGFSEFMASGDRALTAEALLGHGLTSKALKEYNQAVSDFHSALELGPDAEMAVRIRIALVEAELARGRLDRALTASERLVKATSGGGATAALKPQALFLRSKALLLSLGKGMGNGPVMRREAARHMEALYGRGGYWKNKVIQLVDAGIADPDAWTGVADNTFVTWLIADSLRRHDECDRAVALYDELVDTERFRVESLYGRGFCRFDEGMYAAALEDLTNYLDEAPERDTHRAQVAYLRFKASESLFLQADAAEADAAGARYVEMMNAFVESAPEHERAFEAWFRLGEWHRERAEYLPCANAFANVEGDPAFEIKAGFLSAQCHVEAVLALPDDSPAPTALVVDAVTALDAFLSAADGYAATGNTEQARLLQPLRAKATMMAAAIVTRSGAGTMSDRLVRLDGFEDRFPDQDGLVPEVRSLRIVAYRMTGDLDGAGIELEALLTEDAAGAYRADSLQKLGIVFLEEASRRDEDGDALGAARSRRVALRIYEALLADARAGITAPPEGLAGLEKLVADLRAQVPAEAGG